MKFSNKPIHSLAFTSLCAFALASLAFAEQYEIQRGSREIIPLERITEDNCRRDVVRIKVTKQVLPTVQAAAAIQNSRSIIRTEVDELDEVISQFGVTSYNPTFGSLYNSQSRSTNARRDRHSAWGFDQWYDVTITNGSVREAVEAFSSVADVEICEPIYNKVRTDVPSSEQISEELTRAEWTPNDSLFGDQWHYNNTGQFDGTPGADISLPQAWEIERGFEEVIVAVIDGGIQQDHPDLKANLWSGGGYNFVDDSPVITGEAHGTHVGGTVGAVNNNKIGVSGVAGGSGTGDGVRLMSCQIFTSTGSGGSHTALIWAADNGATIAQNSWGYGDSLIFNQVDLDAIDYFNQNGGGDALENGIAFFTAGNRGLEGTYFPGSYEGAFSVAATNYNDGRASYSNYATWVDISAPGGARETKSVLSTLNGSKYGYKDGTSMACPHVSGVAALIVSAAYRNGVVLTATELKEILQSTSDKIFTGDLASKMGAGRLNAGSALEHVKNTYFPNVTPPRGMWATTKSATSVEIGWELNSDQMNVIVVSSTNGQFGTPETGVAYSVGDQINGGGTVVYTGNEVTATQDDLQPGDSVSYRSYSVQNGTYSGYRTAYAVTDHFLELGTTEDPIVIDNLDELKIISEFPRYWDNSLVLNGSLNAAATKDWNDGQGWSPLGNKTIPFSGSFNGRGYVIDSISINRSGEYNGFFGLIDGGSIDSLGVINGSISGKSYNGVIVGRVESGTLSNTYSTGVVSGSGFSGGFGGIIRNATVSDCYNHASVTGGQNVGGFVGSCFYTDISNIYSIGSVTAENAGGGLIGVSDKSGGHSSFWDSEVSNMSSSKVGNGKTTSQMKTESTFSEWNFSTIWQLKSGEYPSFQWQDGSGNGTTTEVRDSLKSDTLRATVVDTTLLGATLNDGYTITTAVVDSITDSLWRTTDTLSGGVVTNSSLPEFISETKRVETVSSTTKEIDPVGITFISISNSTEEMFAAAPNPVYQTENYVSIFVPANYAGIGSISIYDAVGNRVDFQNISVGQDAAVFQWDLCNGAGQKVSSGNYIAMLIVKDQNGTIKSSKVSIGVKQ